ncbi:hypothetical protein Y032_0930g3089 [Ancylostoma ceylanicum]|nr:hypothetical protein Y032_0930g3089 [Ancylostoma ceylanicum]
MTSSTDQLTILGDFNVNDCNWELKLAKTASSKKFLDLFDSLGIEQLVHYPTRNSSILDIIVSSNDFVAVEGILPPLGCSDHNIVSFCIRMESFFLHSYGEHKTSQCQAARFLFCKFSRN